MKHFLFQPHLQPGNRVAVIAPSGTVPHIQSVLEQVRIFLENWSLEMVTYSELIGTNPVLPTTAHTDAARAHDLIAAVQDSSIHAIWPLRGGYGVLRLLPYLDAIPHPLTHKWIIGFSDISVLHAYVYQQWGWPSIHGPNLRGSATGHVAAEDILHLRRGICEGVWTLPSYTRCINIDEITLASTPWVGGNLTVYSYLVGTPYMPSVAGCVLLLEDLAEPLRKIDGALWQLYWGMQWEKHPPRAIVFGEFQTIPSETSETIEQITHLLQEWETRLQPLGIGCAYTTNIGHGARNHPVMLGAVPGTAMREKST